MKSYRRAISLGVSALVLILVIIAIAFGVYLDSTLGKTVISSNKSASNPDGIGSSDTPSTLSVPPPTTTSGNLTCKIENASMYSALILSGELNISSNPTIPLNVTRCSYTYLHIAIPVACGVMCGGGIGYMVYYWYELQLSFSITNMSASIEHNLTISSSSMNDLFHAPPGYVMVSLDSQAVSWYSSPPCIGGQGVEANCLSDNATSVAIQFPPSLSPGIHLLSLNSTKELVP